MRRKPLPRATAVQREDDEFRQLLSALSALKRGDFDQRLPDDWLGLPGKVADTFNEVVGISRLMVEELGRIKRTVGKEGKITQRAALGDISGGWADAIGSVNSLIGDLVHPTSEMARVIGAVANGDLSQTMSTNIDGKPLKGEFLRTVTTVNTMVDQLRSFASEVTRVAREVGTDGVLGGQARVEGVSGTWKDLTESVNSMAGNLTAQVRNIAEVTTAVANGNLSKKITVDVKGEILELKNTINTMVDQLRSFASEVTRVAREVGSEGELGGQARVQGVSGTWKDLTDSVNFMASNLTTQVRNIAAVTTAVANGDLSKKITVDVKGEVLELKITVNTMVDQLNSFASEVTRMAREVGSEGRLGGQAEVRGVGGTWKDLTDSVNSMAGNLTNQVRGIAKVVTAVANGDLKQKLLVEAKGEIAALADTINSMTSTLATFADQVTTVAREVGVEGKLGSQANVPGAAGTWRDLTDNVNQLAANLTTQLRAIADVATAVTKGDLSRSIQVAAHGEVAFVKDNINEMIRNLRDTTHRNMEEDWLKTNLAKFTRMLQGQKNLLTVGRMILSELAPVVAAQQGVFYVMSFSNGEPELRLLASYAYRARKNVNNRFKLGEGLVGQAALEKERILLTEVPEDYIQISSGLGAAAPLSIVVLPIVFEGQVKGVMELSSFEQFSPIHQTFLEQLTESIGIVLNTIEANTRTEDLLKQSQSLASELQNRQEELQQTNQELEEKAHQLAVQNAEVERKNYEVEQARQELEGKAQQLTRTSKYKSEFLANMSHELRTPLNSLLILADQLASNPEGNLNTNQVKFAKTIHESGHELLKLINDILDLSKIESGTAQIEVSDSSLRGLRENLERTFRPVAEKQGLEFQIEMDASLPAAVRTDSKRMNQILKNLLSNAFKFTEHGRVTLRIYRADGGWSPADTSLNEAAMVIAFSVEDTGIGISEENQAAVFEAFQQVDGSASRKYGGTGLGLAISRDLAHLLGGEIRLNSEEKKGSVFTLYLPQDHFANAAAPFHGVVLHPGEVKETEAPKEDRGPVVAEGEQFLAGRKALIVDDDIRNLFAMTSLLERYGMIVKTAETGQEAIAALKELPDVDVIFMDIMLPEMDGYETMRVIRAIPAFKHLPIIALTAKAMKGDREKCLKAGASDYLAKPVETTQLLGTLRTLLTG